MAVKKIALRSGQSIQGFIGQAVAQAVQRWKDPISKEPLGLKTVLEDQEVDRIKAIREIYVCTRPRCCGNNATTPTGTCSMEECELHREDWVRKDRML